MTLSAEYKIKVRGKLKWRPALFSLLSLESEWRVMRVVR